uniref:AT-hook motif nuclear-localized protein n=1 Tax=Kalanchoe fedtschenkoi TaxID=63787 RepID=A0A7N1A132_KALFE
MEAVETNSSKEDMLSPLSDSDSHPHPLQLQPHLHPPLIHTRPANPNPHLLSTPVNDNNNSSSSSFTGFTLLSQSANGAVLDSDSGQKKKRGRPRKYDADGNLRASYASPLGVSPPPPPHSTPMLPPPGFGISPPASFGGPDSLGSQKARSPSPYGFGEIFARTAVGDFTPHVVTVSRGEDVAGKILLLGQQGHKGICVLSAIGVVSNVTIRQPTSAGGILTYEGRFEILSLTGSYTVASNTGSGGGKGWVGALSVSLAGPDGRVVGGGVAGSMTAASPTQLVVGSFTPGGYKPQKRKYVRKVSPAPMNILDPVMAAKPISQAMPAEEAFHSQSSPSLEQSHEEDDHNSNQQQMAQQPTHSIWNFGPSPDINLSIHGRVTP